jgi:hypothetical protein
MGKAWEMIRRVAAGQDRSYVYHGFSVRLPPQVHALVHDPSLPEHVRGFHLARHLLTHQPGSPGYPHTGESLGQDWHRDSYWAARDAHEANGEGRTPYVLKALKPERQHWLSEDQDRKPKADPILVRSGSPVHFTGLYWHHPEAQVPGSPHEGDEHELDFPEPITARA